MKSIFTLKKLLAILALVLFLGAAAYASWSDLSRYVGCINGCTYGYHHHPDSLSHCIVDCMLQ